ncbi:hypothetical protein P20439_2322 [Pseudoalteromonas sp. BSi20439]|nr:hypothetical protein P20439_2322 [Pseudoalteromonas sp. BSi20439]
MSFCPSCCLSDSAESAKEDFIGMKHPIKKREDDNKYLFSNTHPKAK